MLLSYQYKLRPSNQQSDKLLCWLDMLRATSDWCLRDKIDRCNQKFLMGDYCDLRATAETTPLTCSLVKGTQFANPWKTGFGKAKKEGEKKRSRQRYASLMPDANLINLKVSGPWHQKINAAVLQSLPARVNEAFSKFVKGAGFPKFKGSQDFKSFSYKPGHVKLKGSKIYLSKIGWMRFYNSRSIPEGFEIRIVTVRHKANDWFVSLRIEDKTVPEFFIIFGSEIKFITGCDMGLTKLVYLSNGWAINNPLFATNKKTKGLIKIRQRQVSGKQRGSKKCSKAQWTVTALHGQLQKKAEAYKWWFANKSVGKSDTVAVEELPVKNMIKQCNFVKLETGRFLPNGQSAKRGCNRSISDASWYGLTQKLEYVAANSGKKLYMVNPRHTSQTCSKCRHVDKENRNGEKFICINCGHIDDANLQAARNVITKAIETYGLTIAKKVISQQVRVDCSEPVQLNLFEIESRERLSENTLPSKGQRRVGKNPEGIQLSLGDVKEAIS